MKKLAQARIEFIDAVVAESLRRFAQHRSGQMKGAWDTALDVMTAAPIVLDGPRSRDVSSGKPWSKHGRT